MHFPEVGLRRDDDDGSTKSAGGILVLAEDVLQAR